MKVETWESLSHDQIGRKHPALCFCPHTTLRISLPPSLFLSPPPCFFSCPHLRSFHLSVTVLPSFAKTPGDLTVRVGATARLECAAEGHPTPQMAWQKDGGTDFPAARERRMHVMPDDDVFFITDVKPEDAGVYSCTARNSAGTASANATLTVLGKNATRASTLAKLMAGNIQLPSCCYTVISGRIALHGQRAYGYSQ